MAIDIVDLPIDSMVMFHGKMLVYQGVVLNKQIDAQQNAMKMTLESMFDNFFGSLEVVFHPSHPRECHHPWSLVAEEITCGCWSLAVCFAPHRALWEVQEKSLQLGTWRVSFKKKNGTLWWTNMLPWKITIFNGKIDYKWPFSIAFC